MKKLVAYFSASGVTEGRAKELAELLQADLYEIEPKVKYTREDLDWTNKKSRSTVEMNDRSFRPELKDTDPDLSAYDEVYIGFPVWWYTAPTIINTFLETADLKGKEIYFFATSGGSGIDKAVKELSAQYPELSIKSGKLMNRKAETDF